MSRRISGGRQVTAVLVGLLVMAGAAPAQTTWYVDDDAPNDPGPGDPTVSDPLEDGSAEHPFDAIQEGVDAAANGDTVLALDGIYTGDGNRDIDLAGRLITVRSANGPDTCIIDCQGTHNDPHRGFYFHSRETTGAVLDGLTIAGGYITTWGGGGGIFCQNRSGPTITNCIITENTTQEQWGGGISCYDASSPFILNCVIAANAAATGGGISTEASSPTIFACVITDNTVGSSGGGIHCGGGSPTITNCVIADNGADSGGGIRCASGSPTIRNCLIAGNLADSLSGGGMYSAGTPTITNCTFTANEADDYGGGMYCFNSTLTVSNCIFWNNTALVPELAVWWDSHLTILYSDVQGGEADIYVGSNCTLNWGDGNIDADPLFADPAGADYHLTADSPCVDTGDPAFVPQPDERDIDGQMRVWDGDDDGQWRVDMGADEFASHCPGDLDGDGDVDLSDLATLLSNYGMTSGAQYEDGDLDGDGDVDLTDLAALLAVYGSTC
jgi:hypothetical protein